MMVTPEVEGGSRSRVREKKRRNSDLEQEEEGEQDRAITVSEELEEKVARKHFIKQEAKKFD